MTTTDAARVVRTGVAKNGSVELAYEVFGSDAGEPLLLIMGLGMQMLMWHVEFCAALVLQGFQVVRMDNRDTGLSTHLHELGEPEVFKMIWRPKSAAVYTVDDMAADAVAVLDDLGWRSANILGGSLGGMIAQAMAIRYPDRVRTLTSMMSSPAPRLGRSTLRMSLKLAALFRRPLHDRDEAGRQLVDMFELVGSLPERFPLDEPWLREVGARSFDRAYDPPGKLRQQAALLASPDKRKALARLHVPSLVIHGDVDPVFRLSGGRATARALSHSRFVVFAGMGHGALPRSLWPAIAEELRTLSAEARRDGASPSVAEPATGSR